MTVSQKQLEANKKNAQKGGVKTSKGKAIVKFNALKHGLLSKEVVITVGEGAENQEEFNTLLNDLNAQLSPEGTLGSNAGRKNNRTKSRATANFTSAIPAKNNRGLYYSV
jgi:hypothetical protein